MILILRNYKLDTLLQLSLYLHLLHTFYNYPPKSQSPQIYDLPVYLTMYCLHYRKDVLHLQLEKILQGMVIHLNR
jgi:hypothetical protein